MLYLHHLGRLAIRLRYSLIDEARFASCRHEIIDRQAVYPDIVNNIQEIDKAEIDLKQDYVSERILVNYQGHVVEAVSDKVEHTST